MDGFNYDGNTSVSKFIDYLMSIYDNNVGRSNPSWYTGKQMINDRYNYKTVNSEDVSGFKPELVSGGQNMQVARHILGHGGVIMTGRGLDETFDIIPGKHGLWELYGYAVSGAYQIGDFIQTTPFYDEERRKQSIAEILDDYAARDVANAFTRAYQGKYTREELKQKLFSILSNINKRQN